MKTKTQQYALPTSALRISAVHNDVQFLRRLIRHGVPPNQTNDKGYTALHMAVLCGNEEVVQLLLEAGARPNTQEKTGRRTPLYDAVRLGYHGIVATLLNGKADPDIPDSSGETPIIRASKDGHIPLVYLLARKGAKVDVVSSDRRGLITCLRAKTEETAKWLKGKGAPDKPAGATGKGGALPDVETIRRGMLLTASTEHMIGVIRQAGRMPQSTKREAIAILKRMQSEELSSKGCENE